MTTPSPESVERAKRILATEGARPKKRQNRKLMAAAVAVLIAAEKTR